MSHKSLTILIFTTISVSSGGVIAFMISVDNGQWTYFEYLWVLGALPVSGAILWLLVALAARRFRDAMAITVTGLFAHGLWSAAFIALFFLVVGIASGTEGVRGGAGGILVIALLLAVVAAAPAGALWATWQISRQMARLFQGQGPTASADGASSDAV